MSTSFKQEHWKTILRETCSPNFLTAVSFVQQGICKWKIKHTYFFPYENWIKISNFLRSSRPFINYSFKNVIFNIDFYYSMQEKKKRNLAFVCNDVHFHTHCLRRHLRVQELLQQQGTGTTLEYLPYSKRKLLVCCCWNLLGCESAATGCPCLVSLGEWRLSLPFAGLISEKC